MSGGPTIEKILGLRLTPDGLVDVPVNADVLLVIASGDEWDDTDAINATDEAREIIEQVFS